MERTHRTIHYKHKTGTNTCQGEGGMWGGGDGVAVFLENFFAS
jgi:hypothetical protein